MTTNKIDRIYLILFYTSTLLKNDLVSIIPSVIYSMSRKEMTANASNLSTIQPQDE